MSSIPSSVVHPQVGLNISSNRTVAANSSVTLLPRPTDPAVLEQPAPSSIISGLGGFDSNWLAFIIVVSAGASLFFAFALARFIRWSTLRKPIPMRAENLDQSFAYRSRRRQIIQWPGTILQKLALYSFTAAGVPSVGLITLIVLWIGFCILITLVNVQLTLKGIAYRLPYVGMANIPVLFLSAFKNSPLGVIAGLSYEKINAFHRWVGRLIVAIFLTHGIMMGVFTCAQQGISFSTWTQRTDVRWGIAALSCLILLISFAGRPLRNKFHELFRWTHILLTIGFVFAAYYHQPQTMLPILIVMCLLGLEWLPRLLKMALPIPRATTQILNGNVVRITIPIPTNRLGKYFWGHWEAGSHIRITIPSIGLFQTHPLTIASIPSDGNIRLYIRARTGFTRRVYERAAAAVVSGTQASLNVHIEGIYGGRFPSFAKFDVVLLIAGGIGATFTVPILRDLVNRAKQSNTRRQCKRLAFVWVVKNRAHLSWFSQQLSDIMISSSNFVAMRLYVTEDKSKTTSPSDGSLPSNLLQYVRYAKPSVPGLVEQAADEALALGRLGIGTCGSRTLVTEVKNSVVKQLRGELQDIYCHAEEFEF